jgi:hypothetical protein
MLHREKLEAALKNDGLLDVLTSLFYEYRCAFGTRGNADVLTISR